MLVQNWKKLVLHFVILQMARFITSSIANVSENKIEMLNWMHSTLFSDICTRGAARLQTPDRVQWEWRRAAGSRLGAVLLSWAEPGRAVCSVWLAAVSPLCKAPLVFSSPSTWLSHCNPVSLCQERHLLVTKFLTRGADIERDHILVYFSFQEHSILEFPF